MTSRSAVLNASCGAASVAVTANEAASDDLAYFIQVVQNLAGDFVMRERTPACATVFLKRTNAAPAEDLDVPLTPELLLWGFRFHLHYAVIVKKEKPQKHRKLCFRGNRFRLFYKVFALYVQ